MSVYDTKFFTNLLGRAFRAMKNGVYFIVIAVLVAELFKIMDYANLLTVLTFLHFEIPYMYTRVES